MMIALGTDPGRRGRRRARSPRWLACSHAIVHAALTNNRCLILLIRPHCQNFGGEPRDQAVGREPVTEIGVGVQLAMDEVAEGTREDATRVQGRRPVPRLLV